MSSELRVASCEVWEGMGDDRGRMRMPCMALAWEGIHASELYSTHTVRVPCAAAYCTYVLSSPR